MGSFAPKGHAKLDPRSPLAFANCDCCGFLYRRVDLRAQTEWRGNKILPTGYLHCDTCWDRPNPTLRPIVLPPDPVPVNQPRKEADAKLATFDETNIKWDTTLTTFDGWSADKPYQGP